MSNEHKRVAELSRREASAEVRRLAEQLVFWRKAFATVGQAIHHIREALSSDTDLTIAEAADIAATRSPFAKRENETDRQHNDRLARKAQRLHAQRDWQRAYYEREGR